MTTSWRRCAVLLATGTVIAGCGSGSTATPGGTTTSVPSATPTTTPVTTPVTTSPTTPPSPPTVDPAASSTTTVTSVTTGGTTPPTSSPEPTDDADLRALYESATPLVDDDADCEAAWTDLSTTSGEVTFARGGDLFSFDPLTGDLICLGRVDRDPISLDWNPPGDRLLVDQDLVVTEAGQQPSGFEPATTGLSWSHPAGTALIAPSPDGSSLRHVDADDPTDDTDIRALEVTWAAAYHPSGLAIVSAGIDADGTPGLFLASNRGVDPQALVILEDPTTTITEVTFAHHGDWITFVHDHTGGVVDEGALAHIHRLQIAGLVVTDVQDLPDVVPLGLIASEQDDGTIAWQEPYTRDHVRTVTWDGSTSRELRFPDTVTDPVGFLNGGTAAAVVFPLDEDGDRQLWLFPPEGDPVLVARGVTAATTRTIHHPDWSPPPFDIEQQAVG